jgi:hypothetical protein
MGSYQFANRRDFLRASLAGIVHQSCQFVERGAHFCTKLAIERGKQK